ncbi:transporter [Halotalea alkalilenta]|uniref:transporter n=1 Tax=Halotalea alkalilenta TaxID=376489 RepID=UPI0006933E78|nr:transporter [Halotalea alkalilenta]
MTIKAMKYAIALMAVLAAPAQALEFAPGDYEPLPDGSNFFLTYYKYSHSDAFYSQGDKTPGDNKLRTDVTMLRFIHAYHPVENVSIQPQMILPFGRAKAYGDSSALGKSSGMGDAIVGMPVLTTLATPGKDILVLAPFIYLPTGAYDQDKPLNLGENRWRFLLQAAWTHHFSERWALDTGADVSWVTKNDEYAGQTQRQRPRYEYQAYLRYSPTPQTQLGLGGGWITGAASSLDGAAQHDRLSTTYARLSVAQFISPTVQLQAVVGRDLKVEQGFKADTSLTLRLGMLL